VAFCRQVMVSGALADSAPTSQPCVRAFPSRGSSEELRPSPGLFGNRGPTGPNGVILPRGPGSRLEANIYDDLNQRLGIRMIFIDRPGFGKTLTEEQIADLVAFIRTW